MGLMRSSTVVAWLAPQQNILRCIFLFILISPAVSNGQESRNQVPKTVDELRSAIGGILKETGVPAAAVALMNEDGNLNVFAVGKADRERNIDATPETMFRIGSTSKILVALSVLKLQEQGKLRLEDKLKDIIPEIAYQNPWENTNPVLVVHLLEHTTGWPDLHLPEHNQFDDEKILTLKEALDFHPHSRVSRWVPGTRMSYSNIGPNVAAYIVEKLSGQPYEDFVRDNFFIPLGMKTATYRRCDHYQKLGAKLYKEGHPSRYGHMLMRASGSINASANDMAALLKFMVNAGKSDSLQILNPASIDRLHLPTTTTGARAGLRYGYALGIYTSPFKNFTYYKHGGGVGNSACDFSYLPPFGVGYCVMINSDNLNGAIWQIGDLIREYQTQHFPSALPSIITTKAISKKVNGYFQEINPRSNPINLPSISAARIWTQNDTLFFQEPILLGDTRKYVHVGNSLYQSVDKGRVELVGTDDPLEGSVFELANVHSGTVTYGNVSGLWIYARIVIAIAWCTLTLCSLLALPGWMIFCKVKNRVFPFRLAFLIWIPPICAVVALGLFMAGAMSSIELLAKPTVISVGIMMMTLLFFVSSVASTLLLGKELFSRQRLEVVRYFFVLGLLHTGVAFYFLSYGLIGLRTWA